MDRSCVFFYFLEIATKPWVLETETDVDEWMLQMALDLYAEPSQQCGERWMEDLKLPRGARVYVLICCTLLYVG